MKALFQPWQLLLLILAGWTNRRQRDTIEYLLTENRVLREKLGKKRILLSDDQRRRLAVKGKILGRKVLEQRAGIVGNEKVPACPVHQNVAGSAATGSRLIQEGTLYAGAKMKRFVFLPELAAAFGSVFALPLFVPCDKDLVPSDDLFGAIRNGPPASLSATPRKR
jgi:hypothetical protein